MRLTESSVAPFRSATANSAGHVGLSRLGAGSIFTSSWTFFPLELGDSGNDIVAILRLFELM